MKQVQPQHDLIDDSDSVKNQDSEDTSKEEASTSTLKSFQHRNKQGMLETVYTEPDWSRDPAAKFKLEVNFCWLFSPSHWSRHVESPWCFVLIFVCSRNLFYLLNASEIIDAQLYFSPISELNYLWFLILTFSGLEKRSNHRYNWHFPKEIVSFTSCVNLCFVLLSLLSCLCTEMWVGISLITGGWVILKLYHWSSRCMWYTSRTSINFSFSCSVAICWRWYVHLFFCLYLVFLLFFRPLYVDINYTGSESLNLNASDLTISRISLCLWPK